MLDVAGFRAAYPVFADTTAFPDAQINFWLAAAPGQVNYDRLGTSGDLGFALFVAHNLTLAAQDAKAGVTGAFGGVSGPVSSKSVGGVSKSIDVSSSAFANAGYLNATSYGRQLYTLLRKFSLGGAYIAPPPFNPDFGLLPPFGGAGVFPNGS